MLSPLCAASSFLAMAALFVGAVAYAFHSGRPRLSLWEAAPLALILALAAYLRFSFAPGYFRIYTDEPYYLRVGALLADSFGGETDPGFGKSYGWPSLLALCFAVFGPSARLALGLCATLGTLSVALMHLALRRLTGLAACGLAGAFLLAVWPLHVQWSASAETNVPAAAFALALFVVWLHRERRPAWVPALLLFGLSACALAMRPEVLVLIALLALVSRRERGAVWPLLLGVLAALPNLIAYVLIHMETNIPAAEKAGLWPSALALVGVFGASALFPWPFLALAAAQAVLGARRFGREVGLLGGWALGTLLLLYASFAGALAAPERLLIAPGLPLLMLAGFGLGRAWQGLRPHPWLRAAGGLGLLALMAFAVWPGLSEISRPNPPYELQTDLPELIETALPPGCALIANQPEMYLGTTRRRVLSPEEAYALAPRTLGCAYFVWDLTCYEWRDEDFRRRCDEARAHSAPEPAWSRFVFPAPMRERVPARAALYSFEGGS